MVYEMKSCRICNLNLWPQKRGGLNRGVVLMEGWPLVRVVL